MIAVSIYALAVWGLKLGIDFTGGSLMEVEYKNERSSNDFIKEAIKSSGVEDVIIQPSGDKGAILRFKDIDEETHQDILSKLRGDKESDYLAEKNDHEHNRRSFGHGVVSLSSKWHGGNRL